MMEGRFDEMVLEEKIKEAYVNNQRGILIPEKYFPILIKLFKDKEKIREGRKIAAMYVERYGRELAKRKTDGE